MPERVRIKTNAGFAAKMLLEESLPVHALAEQRLAGRAIDVRLDPPAADDVPAPLFHPLFDFFEHNRITLRNPLVELGGAGDKGHIGKFFHAIQCRPKSGKDLLIPFVLGPTPHRIDVGMADHIKLLFSLRILRCDTFFGGLNEYGCEGD